MRPLLGVLIFLALAAPWHVAAARDGGPAFQREYIVRQHLGRFRGGDTAHRAPVWFYVPVFFVLCLPWSVTATPAVVSAWQRRKRVAPGGEPRDEAGAARTFCVVWALTVFVLFSLSGSKLVSYILPLLPPAALLSADWCVRTAAAGRRTALAVGLTGALVLLGAVLAVVLLRETVAAEVASRTGRPLRLDTVPAGVFGAAAAVLGAGAAGTLAALALTLARRHMGAFAAMAAGMAGVAGAAAGLLLPQVDAALLSPVRDTARLAARAAGPYAPLALAIGPPRRPSALFYLPDARLRGVGDAQRVPEVADPARLAAFASAHPNGVVMADPGHAAAPPAGWRPVASVGGWAVLVGPEWRRR